MGLSDETARPFRGCESNWERARQAVQPYKNALSPNAKRPSPNPPSARNAGEEGWGDEGITGVGGGA